jgi:hypothetical protein
MDSNNIFSGGQNSDLSKTITAPNQYLKSLNFRPITELGESTGSLTNIKGNECAVKFPTLRGVYKIQIDKKYTGTTFNNGVVTLTINGQIVIFNIVENTTMSELYSTLILLPNVSNNPLSVNPDFSVSYNEEYLIIYQNTTYSTCDITDSTEASISISVNNIANSSLVFVDKDENIYTTQFYYVPPVSNEILVIIGSTFINETNYLFTCGQTNTNKIGQIWSLDYNDLTQVATLKLLYNNFLNFSVNTSIAPSAAIGRYEIPTIQRIYWTDFSNPVRSINTQDPQLMSISPDLINLRPSISMNIPVLKNILDGQALASLDVYSTYQCSYRLLKNNGALTNYSPISNLIYPVAQQTGFFDLSQPNFASLADVGVTTANKAIEWEIDGLDTSFDIIEFIAIIRTGSDSQASYKCYKFDTKILNGNNTITAIFKNDLPNYTEISLNEFLIENTSFTHCKTLEQKDNRLFFANIRNEVSEYLDTYDTRAYRFGTGGDLNTIKVKKFDSDTSTTTYPIATSNDYNNIPEATDLVPVLNLGMSTYDDSLYNNSFKYQKDGTTVGGEGLNIKYSFGNVLLRSDDISGYPWTSTTLDNGTTRDNNSSASFFKNGFRRAGGQLGSLNLNPFSNGSVYQTYRQNNIKMSMGLEYLNGLFKSYQHNEIYRFGIMFYSKTGESTFVKWIGDIKMPDYSDLINPLLKGTTEAGTGCDDFRSMYFDISGTGAYCNIPYIEFEVNIDNELSKLIDGYQIVRVKREETDKTIVSQGLITQVATGLGSASGELFMPVSHYISFGGFGNADPPTYGITNPTASIGGLEPGLAHHSHFAYQSLSNVVEKTFPYQTDDQFLLTERYGMSVNGAAINPDTSPIPGPSYEQYYYINKYYKVNHFFQSQTNTYGNRLKIFAGQYVDQDGDIIINGIPYHNRDYFPDITNPTIFDSRAYAQGCPTVIINANFATGSALIDWDNFQCTGDNSDSGYTGFSNKMMGVHYRSKVLKSQYNGRTYLNRSEVEYISTGAYAQTDKSNIYKTKVFGGDIYHGILDMQKCIKNWAGNQPSPGKKHSQTWYFPHQSSYNVDLRGGAHVNADLDNDGGSNASAADQYQMGSVYKLENTLNRYYPKPIFFNETGDYNNRIYYSLVKINGENSDSWSSIPVNNYYDVEGNYGGINALVILRNNMYFLQDRALGVLLINPVAMINSGSNSIDTPIKLGQGKTIERHNYYSIDTGTKHQWSVYRSNQAITFVDVRHKKIYLFDGQQLNPISDTQGNKNIVVKLLHDNVLIQDNPIIGNGILTTFDFYNNEFLYTFLTTYKVQLDEDDIRSRYTLAYNELTKSFTSFYSFTPYIYINNNNKLYSLPDYLNPSQPTTTSIYLHNVGNYSTFYGTVYPSKLKVNINTNPLITKITDNLSWLTESIKDNLEYVDDFIDDEFTSDNINYLNDTFKKIRCYNEYQNTDYIDLTVTNPITNIRKSEQGWNIQTLRNKVNLDTTNINTKSIFDPSILTKTTFGDRLRDKYVIVDLYYDNALNNRFIVHNLKSTYRLSDR